LFFNWFKSFNVFEYDITYSFSKHACPLTCRNKMHVSKLTNGTFIESEHLPLRNFKILYNSQIEDAAPCKNPSEDITTNTKRVIKQNNFTNNNFNNIWKQLPKTEKQIQKTIIFPVETTKLLDQKLKNLVSNHTKLQKLAKLNSKTTKMTF